MKTKNSIVYSSMEYDKFRKHPSNPETRKPDTRLRESMRRYGWLPSCPATVVADKNGFLILEGHRRSKVAEELGIPIRYVVIPEQDGLDPRAISSAVDPWSTEDHVQSMAQTGHAEYQNLQRFSTSHGISLNASAVLLSNGVTGVHRAIADGEFHVSSMAAGEKASRIMHAIRGPDPEKPRCKWWRTQRVAIAVARMIRFCGNAFDVNRMVKKIETHTSRLSECSNATRVIEMLQGIYNDHVAPEDKLAISMLVEIGMAKQKQALSQRRAKAKHSDQ